MSRKTKQVATLSNGKTIRILTIHHGRAFGQNLGKTHVYNRKDVFAALGLSEGALNIYDLYPSEHYDHVKEPGDPMAYITDTALLTLPGGNQNGCGQRELIIELIRLNLIDTL
jgi:hypothetical protein